MTNTWRDCISINAEEDKETIIKKCEAYPGCRVEHVDVSKYLDFTVCVPEYPEGFNLKNNIYSESNEELCGMATVTCTVPREPQAAIFGEGKR